MPELPEVETVKNQLIDENLVGQQVLASYFEFPKLLKTHSPSDFQNLIKGQTILGLQRRGKHILVQCTRGTLVIHLRMSGQFYVTKMLPENLSYIRAYLKLSSGFLLFHDVRKFGTWHFVDDVQEHLKHLGVEPLSNQLKASYMKDKLQKSHQPIKPKLLDQTFIAGLGNIYADEALWHSRIAPQRKSSSLSANELETLKQAIVSTLEKAISDNGSSLGHGKGNFKATNGISGKYQYNFKAYAQTGKPCARCKRSIERVKFFGRSTHFCSFCQK